MKFDVFNTSSDKVRANYSLSLGLLNTERKPSRKTPVNRAGQPTYIFNFTGRVEKILTGSISDGNRLI